MIERVVDKICLSPRCSGVLIALRSVFSAGLLGRLQSRCLDEVQLGYKDVLPGTSGSSVPWTDCSGPGSWVAIRIGTEQ
jgi:hypothetical protein